MNHFGIGSLSDFECLDQVGEGTYGYVYKAKDRRNGEIVALKRLILHRESAGFPINAVREIKFLKFLQHRSIVQLKDVITSKGCEGQEPTIRPDAKRDQTETKRKRLDEEDDQSKDILRLCGNLYFVFEFVEHDLGGLVDAKYQFQQREIKSIIKQILEALEYLHEKRIIHRDIKSSNILISNMHVVKLADFGLARMLPSLEVKDSKPDMTNNVITLWYRPPELLLGSTRYTSTVDIWSVGCVLAELELSRPFLPGKTEVEQLELIFRTMGTPTEESWPGFSQLPNYEKLPKNQFFGNTLRTNKLSDHSFGLLERLMSLDPSRRASAKNALTNIYFHSKPTIPADPRELGPLFSGEQFYHEFQTKLQRKREEEIKKQSGTDCSSQINQQVIDHGASSNAHGHKRTIDSVR